MRKAAEALDRVVMKLRPANQVLVLRRSKELEAGFLIGETLAVLEGKIKERLLGQLNLAIEAAFDRPSRDGERQRVGRKGARRAAKHVAWKLVEHDDKRERAFSLAFPVAELAELGRLMRDEEFLRYLMVELRVGFEPTLRPGLPPEGKHLFGRRDLRHGSLMTAAPEKASARDQRAISGGPW